MDYLLDTHTLVCYLNGDKQLSKTVPALIENTDNRKFVSICSLWEISIKLGLKKLAFDGSVSEIFDLVEEHGFEIIPISIAHIVE
jgi:PIN domain nuclease of toxin-antitoxin system